MDAARRTKGGIDSARKVDIMSVSGAGSEPADAVIGIIGCRTRHGRMNSMNETRRVAEVSDGRVDCRGDNFTADGAREPESPSRSGRESEKAGSGKSR